MPIARMVWVPANRATLTSSRRLPLLAVLAAGILALVVAATAVAAQPKQPRPLSAKARSQLVAQAKQEGSLNYYTVQQPDLANALAAKFKEKYGITVNVNRAT